MSMVIIASGDYIMELLIYSKTRYLFIGMVKVYEEYPKNFPCCLWKFYTLKESPNV